MRKIGVCGHFGGKCEFLDGQTVKTKIITNELKKQLSDGEVLTVDTYGGLRRIFAQLGGLLGLLKHCEHVMIFPSHNGLRVFAPFLAFFNMFFRRKLHYIVIGGWLPEFAAGRKYLTVSLKKFDRIYVETTAMKRALEQQGYENVVLMPNCKNLRILTEDELPAAFAAPYPLCTFSRVMREKGIEDAVSAVKAVNEGNGKTVFTLDIYGQVDAAQTAWFESLQKQFPAEIRYCGAVPFDKSVEVLKDYFALLFPTRFFTEGIPGTMIDAYAAGVPVISSRWKNFDDIIEDGVVGKGYPFGDAEGMIPVLNEAVENPAYFLQMKTNCIEKARMFSASRVVGDILVGGTLSKM